MGLLAIEARPKPFESGASYGFKGLHVVLSRVKGCFASYWRADFFTAGAIFWRNENRAVENIRTRR